MKTKLAFLFALILCFQFAIGQGKYMTRNGQISFYSEAKLETIEATNRSVTAVIDAASGAMEFSVLIKSFEFEKALMQDHFNETYMESDKYPKSTFKGKIENVSSVKFGTNGSYPVTVAGTLTIHGVAKPVTAKGTITVSGGKITAKSEFTVAISDYGIAVPGGKKDNISNTIKIKVNLNAMQPM